MRKLLLGLGILLLGGTAAAQHHHGDAKTRSPPTPGRPSPPPRPSAPDGTLWLVRANADRVVVLKSNDLGRSFSAPVPLRPSR